MITHNGAWLPSITIGLPVLIILSILTGLVTAWCVLGWIYRVDELSMHDGGAILAGLAFLALTIGSGFGYYPYHGDYHRLQPATGTVAGVDSRFLAASQYVVVTYDGGLVVRCDDSRCATVKPGEQLRLLCTKEHQFGSPLAADGWGCRWAEQ